MKTAAAAPYLLPPEEAVVGHEWSTSEGVPIGDRLEHWDPFTELNAVRVVEVDVDAVRTACMLGEDAALALAATWKSSRTRLSGQGPVVELGALGGLVRVAVSLSVPGTVAGGRLDLRTRLVLRHPGDAPSLISPRRVGSTLWTDEARIALEGAAARFPITAADFTTSHRYPDTAAWALEWNPDDLESPVLGGMRLLVNSGHEALLAALRSGNSDARASAVRSFVTFDVARSLVRGGLQSERFVEDPEGFQEGSVGRMLFELLAAAWPGIPVTTLAARALDDPSRLDAELQAHLGVLE